MERNPFPCKSKNCQLERIKVLDKQRKARYNKDTKGEELPKRKEKLQCIRKTILRLLDTNLTELAEWLAFEDDMTSDPYDDADWADRMES